MKRILSLALCLFTFEESISQDLPKVIPPSPEAAALFKFQDYPLDYSTGLPQISIPIYTIKSGSLTLPITLSYHSSGRKVYDETRAVGLGWELQAGGRISRTVYGDPDDERWDFPSPFRRQADIPSNKTDFLFLAAVAHHPFYPITYYDTQYDIFSYSANNLSGKFILKDENTIKTPVLIPYKPYRIEWHKKTAQYHIEYFDYINITDDKGILYRFGKSLQDGTEYLERSSVGVSSWLLTEIVSADKMDTIYFKYRTFVGERLSVSQQTQLIENHYPSFAAPPNLVSETEYINSSYYNIQRITEIKFKQGRILFNLDDKNCITSLEVKSDDNSVVKTVDFNRSHANLISDGIKPVEKLAWISFKDNSGNESERYTFQYYSGEDLINVRACDLWGYANGTVSSSGLIDMRPFTVHYPTVPIMGAYSFTVEFDYNRRAPNLIAMSNGVLERITFPGDGSVSFVYELNKFFDPGEGIIRNGGGLRIRQKIIDDGKGNLSYKTYKYGEDENGYGFLNIIPSVENISDYTRFLEFVDGAGGPILEKSYTRRTVSSDILPVFSYVSQKPIIYKQVTEYHGTLAENIGKTVYSYDFDDRIAPQSVEGLFHAGKYRFWRSSELRRKADYKVVDDNGSQTYDIQRIINYNYAEFETDVIYGLHFKKKYVAIAPNEPVSYISHWDGLTKTSGIDHYVAQEWIGDGSGPYGLDDWEIYRYADYGISAGIKELISTEEIEFFDGNEFKTITSYTYNSKHLIEGTSKTVTQGEILRREIKYPFDSPEDPVHQQMIAKNMLNFEIEVSEFRDLKPISSVRNNYRDWGTGFIKPEVISTRSGSSPYEPRVTFHSYDEHGNIESVSKDGGPQVSYLYGYKGDFPIAQIVNAPPDRVFHTSFEDAEGNSGYNDCKTGRRSRTGGYNRVISGLPDGIYRLSYFQKVGNYWEFASVDNILVTGGSYNLTLSGQVDEIRFHPQDALMTTYTYDPFEGLISSTDENNVTTYFEYDTHQRLKFIRDTERDLVRQVDYHYKE